MNNLKTPAFLCILLALLLAFGAFFAPDSHAQAKDPKGKPAQGKSAPAQEAGPLEGLPPQGSIPDKPVTIAVVEISKAIEASNEGRALQDKFKATYDKTNEKMQQKGKDLERRADEFNAAQASMTDADRDKRRSALEKEIADFEKETEKASQDFRASVEKAMTPLLERAEKIVADLAKANDWLAVVENGSENAIIYANPQVAVLDITSELTQALNSKKK
jgi:outer membrane protein